MLKQYKNTIRKTFIVCAIAASFSACINKDEFFELQDRNGIDAAIWSSEGSVQMHLNRAYDVCMPAFPFHLIPDRYGVHLASDENFFPDADQWARNALGMATDLGNHDVRYTGNQYQGNAGNNRYFDIARCNNAIKFIPEGTMPQALKNRFLGQYYALRAMVYFEMVKVYGGVPMVLEPLDPVNIGSIKGRASARECFQVIISDLDNAMTMLQGVVWDDATERGKINRVAAAALKAKVLMYWASPQFNPLNDPKHPYDAARWQTALEANKEAYDIAVAAGHRLLPNYADIFRVEGTPNTEAILVRTYANNIERRGHDAEYRSRPSSEGGSPYQGFRATTKLLDAYPMKDGNPIGQSGSYTYDPVMFWQNRDPRFEATIAYNGSNWPLSGNMSRKQWAYNTAINEGTVRGVYCKRFTTPSLSPGVVRYQGNIGGNGMDWIEIRFAEVMLNYAECLAATNSPDLAKNLIRELRQRAGIEAGTNDYGLGNVSGVALQDLILNERMIEFAFENKRNSDLRRTRKMHLLAGNMSTIQIELANGATTKAILEAVNPTTNVMFRETININNKSTYLQYFRPYTLVTPNYLPYNVPEFHYFYTFHNDFVNTGVDIQPTIGWAGGTFDPLD
ncbi:RagB/SusD family nutrient uptake outer membrane protein [Pedobacter alpinus]|uniref:RagB/SusD family nutrient uptake outer membrane protein n=1 Tax=Pedobacter alpinus TaxID=1590643 RepID=A0ABW5TM68_9SPHI